MESAKPWRLTGAAVLVVGILFFLRDIGINIIGNTSGWAILFILGGTALLFAGIGRAVSSKARSASREYQETKAPEPSHEEESVNISELISVPPDSAGSQASAPAKAEPKPVKRGRGRPRKR
ncbi:hypothetical protein HYU10_00570 [Candidatus Woesearchaeota archaeon]|nr:hypothetical protein [Candidatus Woesearchaeota archaeon]MBI2661242.1 hypothetical protein [Candidatus Woesearchaeota archaeon]